MSVGADGAMPAGTRAGTPQVLLGHHRHAPGGAQADYELTFNPDHPMGADHDPDSALNVVKMMAGTEDMFAGTVGLVKAVFAAGGVDPKLRQMIILRAAKVLNYPYEWRAERLFVPEQRTF